MEKEPSTTFLVAAAAALLLASHSLYDYFFVTQNKKRLFTMVPGRLPFIGHLHLLNIDFSDLQKVFSKLHEWADTYGKEDGAYEFAIHLGRVVVVHGEDRLLELFKNRPFKVRRDPTLSRATNAIGVDGLITAEGHHWSNQRRIIAPALNKKNVGDYLSKMKMVAGRLINSWENKSSDGSSVVINNDIFMMMANILSIAGYGLDLDFISNADNQLATDVLNLLSTSAIRLVAPFPYWKIPFIGQYLDGGGFKKDRIDKLIGKYVDEYTKNKDNLTDAQRRTFLGKLLENMNDSKAKVTREDVMGNLLTMFLGGTDTNTQAITFAMWKVADDKTGLQDELYNEMKGFDLNNCTFEDINTRLPRLKSFMHEIHRVYGGFPFFILEVVEEIQLGGRTVEPFTPCMVLPRYPTMSKVNPSKHVPLGPDNKPNHEFCPRRWLTIDKLGEVTAVTPNTATSCAFNAFGNGARSCPGRIYSEAMTFIALISLVQRFEACLEDGHEEVYPKFMHIDTCSCDVKMKLKKRKEYVPPSVELGKQGSAV